MKKFPCFLFCLLFSLLLCACNDENPVNPEDFQGEADYYGYKNADCEAVDKWQTVNIELDNSENILSLSLPKKWFVMKVGKSIYLFDKSRDIGYITVGDMPQSDGEKIMEERQHTIGDISCTERVTAGPNKETGIYDYYRSYTYSYKDSNAQNIITLKIVYDSIDTASSEVGISASKLLYKYYDGYLGRLKDKDIRGKNILVLGNSFINSSKIGTFLEDMLFTEGYYITAKSVGYADISSGTWNGYLDEMQNGYYDIIFMCGFYSSSDVYAFAPFVEACEKSGTELIIFPAHNETHGLGAKNSYPQLELIDWAEEINAIMKKHDINVNAFCIDDMHQHSTPLAGYVGAHMIYRALMGEYPPENISFRAMPVSEIKYYLEDYMSDSAVSTVDIITYKLTSAFSD